MINSLSELAPQAGRLSEAADRARRGFHFEVGENISILNIRQKAEDGADSKSEFIHKKLRVYEAVDWDRVCTRSPPLVIDKVETSVVNVVFTRFQPSQPKSNLYLLSTVGFRMSTEEFWQRLNNVFKISQKLKLSQLHYIFELQNVCFCYNRIILKRQHLEKNHCFHWIIDYILSVYIKICEVL